MGIRRRLIVAMVLIGGAVATLAVALIAWDLGAKAHQENKTTEQANSQVSVANEELRAELDGEVASGALTQAQADEQFDEKKAVVSPVEFQEKFGWLISTVTVGVALFALLFVAAAVLWFRDVSLPLTWAQALVLAGIAFGYLVVINGFIPHYIIDIWDNVWPARKGLFVVPLTGDIARWFTPKAIGWEWAWFVPRDMIVAGWYVVTFIAFVFCWYSAQELPKRQPEEISVSPYGRPVLRAGR